MSLESSETNYKSRYGIDKLQDHNYDASDTTKIGAPSMLMSSGVKTSDHPSNQAFHSTECILMNRPLFHRREDTVPPTVPLCQLPTVDDLSVQGYPFRH